MRKELIERLKELLEDPRVPLKMREDVEKLIKELEELMELGG